MKEDIYYFGEITGEKPFEISLAGISHCDGTYKIERKNSSIYCFEYILSGSGSVTCGKNTFIASTGDVYILDKDKNHLYYSFADDPWQKMWFNIDGRLIENLLDAYNLTGVNHIKNAGSNVKKLFSLFLETALKNRGNPDDVLKNTEEIFHSIIRSLYETRIDKPKSLSDGETLKNYIDANISKKISTAELAEHVLRSPSQIIRIFKSEFGVTPYEYAMRRKIEIAKHMLKNTSLRIKEISYRLGFCDEHYFSGYFKSRTGMSPVEYRQK